MTSGTSDTRPLEGPGVATYATAAAPVIGRVVGGLNLHDFRLAGGTALAWYLGHRISDDLDFFTYTAQALDDTAQARLARLLTPISAPQSIDTSSSRTLHATLVTVAGNCDVSFFELQDAVWSDPPERVREGFEVASLRDIGAMKLLAITGAVRRRTSSIWRPSSDTGYPYPSCMLMRAVCIPGWTTTWRESTCGVLWSTISMLNRTRIHGR